MRARYDQVKQRAAALGAERYWEAKNAFLQELLRRFGHERTG